MNETCLDHALFVMSICWVCFSVLLWRHAIEVYLHVALLFMTKVSLASKVYDQLDMAMIKMKGSRRC